MSILLIFRAVGATTIYWLDIMGNFSLFFIHTIQTTFSTKLKLSKFFSQMERVGVSSLAIALITGTFAGAVLALQSYKGFHELGSEDYLGPIVALSMARELGPVLTGLMVAGRVSSAIAAEIGTMRITEQIDALQTLRINTFQYLIVPKVLAGLIVLPLLTLFSMMFGILGGYVVCIHTLGLNSEMFKVGIKNAVEIKDVLGGLAKAGTFGFILTMVGSYKGYYTSGGAKGVGKATTEAVVVSSILIIIANFFLAAILFGP